MDEQATTKAQLMDWITSARAPLDRLIAPLSDERMLLPGVENKSSVKDLLAHISTWEDHLARRLVAAARDREEDVYVISPDEPAGPDGIDALNAYIFTRNAQLTLQEVLANYHRSLHDVLQAVEALSDYDLFDPQGLAQLFGYSAERIIGSDTFYHYPEHIQSIRAWLDMAS